MAYFQHSLPCSPHASSIGVATLGFPWYRSSLPDPRKRPQLQILPHYWSKKENSKMVLNQENMESDQPVQSHSIMHSKHCNHRLVCRSIVLVKQDSLCQLSRPFWNVSSTTFQSPELLIQCLCGFISIGKGYISCMPSFIAVTQLLLSQPMNFSAHPRNFVLMEVLIHPGKVDLIF